MSITANKTINAVIVFFDRKFFQEFHNFIFKDFAKI
jgi:hypothetical protein